MSTGIQANLWLVYAVKRIGFDDWNAVAKQLDKTGIQHNYLLPPYSAAACKKKYFIIRKRFIDNRSPLTDDEEDDADRGKQKVNEEEDDVTEVLDKATEKPLLETMTKVYSQLRQAELRMLLNGDAEARLAKAKKARSKRNKKFAAKDSSNSLSNSGEPSEKPAEKISAAVEEKPVVRKIPDSSLTKTGLPTSKEAREHMEVKLQRMDLQDRVESTDQSAAPPPNAEAKHRIVVLALEAPNNPSRRPSKSKARNKTQKKKIPKDDPSYSCPGFKAMAQKEEDSVIVKKSTADGDNEA
ncbi:hypothetical protein ABFS82_14G213100 [Erythranthe guttata]